MKIFEKLFHKNAKTKDELNQTEREAIVDLLTLGVYADNHLSLAEDETFESLTIGSLIEISPTTSTPQPNEPARPELTKEPSKNF